MKNKKVMAMLLSAGLSVTGLGSCMNAPRTVFGGEAVTEGDEPQEEEVPESTVQEDAPAKSEKKGSVAKAELAATVQSASGGEAMEADTQPSDSAEYETLPPDEGGAASGQEETASSQEETGTDDTGNNPKEETSKEEETHPDSWNTGEADSEKQSEPSSGKSTEGSTEGSSETSKVDEGESETSDEMDPEEEILGPGEELTEELESETEDLELEEELFEDYEYGIGDAYFSGGSYWDKSWYFRRDFRFTQVDKVYGIATASRLARIYEEADTCSQIVGEIPYFALAYVLDEKGEFYYIESGNARGFIPKEDLTVGEYADETVDILGEESFDEANADVEIPDNEAFTYTKTTVQEVISEKNYAITYMAGTILEYPKEGARTIGEVGNAALVYVLEDAGDGWLYVESGDVRGFIRAEMLLTGAGAKAVTEDLGEGTISLAEEVISPEDNRSLYYSLLSVKPALDQMGESLCEYALSFVGKLPYVYGGSSLGFGADCSGFTQSIFGCFGISIPRTAEEQGVSGQAVDGLDNARPGDIIYYGNSPHVGIYIGDGKVVQCSGNSSNTPSNPGKGPTVSAADYMPITSIRRYIIEAQGSVPGMSESGNRQDGSAYSQEQLELIWAIVAQEDNGSYEGALAVISSAMNRTESPAWGSCGGDALTQLTAPGQYCYSLDDYWRPRLGGNVPEYVKQAVYDCLVKGIRNHSHTSFRSTKGKTTGNDAVQIGGNWYFGA